MAKQITDLLHRWSRGDAEAMDDLVPVVYAELRRLARGAMRSERGNHTLQPTALVHEAFVRLVPQQGKKWENRQHFFAVAAQLMRRVLVDHARKHRAKKRGSGRILVELDDSVVASAGGEARQVDLLELDRTLGELAEIDGHRARVVELRYFAGLTIPEIAAVLALPGWSIKKDWMLAKAWLARRLRNA